MSPRRLTITFFLAVGFLLTMPAHTFAAEKKDAPKVRTASSSQKQLRGEYLALVKDAQDRYEKKRKNATKKEAQKERVILLQTLREINHRYFSSKAGAVK